MADLSTPFEDEGELDKSPRLVSVLSRKDRFQLSFRPRKVDLAEERIVEQGQLSEILAVSAQSLCLLNGCCYPTQLLGLAEYNLLPLAIEKPHKRLRPVFADGEIELEFLFRSSVRMTENSDIRLQQPSRRLPLDDGF